MADKLWSFIRNFTAGKYYDAAQIGAMNGAAPFSIGAIFATTLNPATTTSQYVFGNSAVVNTGFGIGTNVVTGGVVSAYNGTKQQSTGPILNSTGALLATATDDTSTQLIADAFYSSEVALQTVGTTRGSASPKSSQLVFVGLTVPASGSQVFYVNGQAINSLAVGLATAVNNVGIGVSSAHTLPCDQTWIAGCFYHNAVYTPQEMAAMFAACSQAKDIVGPSRIISATDPAYMWSVKRGNFDARASWISDGSAATPITMVRTGSWTPTGIGGDLLAADMQFSQV